MKKCLVFLSVSLLFWSMAEIASAVSINLALNPNASATADQEWSGDSPYWTGDFKASQAIDGNPLTMWNAGAVASSSGHHWLIVDLGNIYTVNEIKLFTDNNHTDLFENEYINYDLYVSTNNENWDKLVDSDSLIDSADPDYYMDVIGTDALSIQYVKFDVIGGTHWAHLVELEVWGNPTPEPATILLLISGLIGIAGLRMSKSS